MKTIGKMRQSTLVFLVGVSVLVAAQFFTGAFLRFLMTDLLIFGIYVAAYNLAFGFTGLISLGHATFFGAGAYAAALSMKWLGANVWLALFLGVAAACILALTMGYFATRMPRGIYFLVFTLVFSQIFFFYGASAIWLTGGDEGFSVPGQRILSFGDFELSLVNPTVNYYFVLLFFVATLFTIRKIVGSPFGAVLKGIEQNEERCRFLGYNTSRYKLTVFVISGLFSGLAGGLYSLTYRHVSVALLNVPYSIEVMVGSLIGGAGSFVGPVLGMWILRSLYHYLGVFYVVYMIMIGAIIVLTVMLAPQGLTGIIEQRLKKRE